MRKLYTILFIFIFSSFSFAQTKITFINPGKNNEVFWVNVSKFMRAAAEDLNINLEIIYAEESNENTKIITNSIIQRKIKPDYLIMVNEDLAAPEIIKTTDLNGIKTFLIFDDLTTKQKEKFSTPRKFYENWIGTLKPDNNEAGYLLADYLISHAGETKDQEMNIVAVSGNRSTPSSIERVKGLKTVVSEKNNINLLETVYCNWDEQEAYELTKNLLEKYKKIDIIWAINDSAALGALRAVKEFDLKPGKDIFIGGINWSAQALEKIKTGELECSVGGHFMLGAWTLVILQDLAMGIDFVDETRITELEVNLFEVLNKENIETYLSYFTDFDWDKINFRNFSKFYNHNLQNYNFYYDKIIENIEEK